MKQAICLPVPFPSLAEMINFCLGQFMMGRQFLHQVRVEALGHSSHEPNKQVPDAIALRVEQNILRAIEYCVDESQLESLRRRAVDAENLVTNYKFQPYTWGRLADVLHRFWEDLERESETEYFFHYSREGGRLIGTYQDEWKPVIEAFPSSKAELASGIDCYAIGHYTASVFHMLRLAELGLRVIARERGISSVGKNKPIEFAMWGEVIGKVQKAVDQIRAAKIINSKTRGKKEIASQFYSTILADTQALLPLRDRTMHLRDSCDQGQAQRAMIRVKSMMETMAAKLDEENPRRIAWGFRL
jgi:hypothetical protein